MWAGVVAEKISADLREAVAHKRRVRDDALYTSTFTLLTLLTITHIRLDLFVN